MNTITFDTHLFIRTIKASGMPEQQAEAIAEAFKKATSEELVTKQHLDLKLAELQLSQLKWMIGLAIAQVTALLGILLKIIPH